MSVAVALAIRDLAVAYGGLRALDGVSLDAQRGEIVALVGSNGAGKSTLLRAISRLVEVQQGEMRFEGQDLLALPPHRVVRAGIAHVPEGRRVFATATVRDNLLLGAYGLRDAAERTRRMERAFAAFPILAKRLAQRASTLSGGEQQMLAIARGMMSAPKLLMLDEPSLGIAPILYPVIFNGVQEAARGGTTVLLVEQNVREALTLADRAYVLQTGRVVEQGRAGDLLESEIVRKAYLGL